MLDGFKVTFYFLYIFGAHVCSTLALQLQSSYWFYFMVDIIASGSSRNNLCPWLKANITSGVQSLSSWCFVYQFLRWTIPQIKSLPPWFYNIIFLHVSQKQENSNFSPPGVPHLMLCYNICVILSFAAGSNFRQETCGYVTQLHNVFRVRCLHSGRTFRCILSFCSL